MHYKQRINQITRQHENKKVELGMLKKELASMEQMLEAIPAKIEMLEKVRVFLQTLGETTRNEIMAGLEQITTRCLQSVFGEHFTFEIEVITSRNNTGVEFYLVNHHYTPALRMKPNDNLAGGEVDVIGIGLRFGLLKVINPKLLPNGPIILDEPAKMVDGNRINMIGNLIRELEEIFERQIIMVTHHLPLMEILDHTITVRNEYGRSVVDY